MPELPEAETIVRDLRGKIVGRTIVATKVTFPDVLDGDTTPVRLGRTLKGRTVQAVTRRAKKVVLHFDNDVILAISLGMTGRVVVSNAQRAKDLRHVAVRFDLDDGTALLYDDIRRFGRLELFSADSWSERQEQTLGVEPLSNDFTADKLFELTRTSIVPIRNWLLDQRHVVGIGNIYAAEALFRAGVRPTRRTRTLTRAECARLRDTIRSVLAEAIRKRGTTISDYRDASGEEGGFVGRLQVYDRHGQPCVKCRTLIKRVVFTNRSSFYCPKCQK
jgi:formamidopyrimidine-DNA glycosylase